MGWKDDWIHCNEEHQRYSPRGENYMEVELSELNPQGRLYKITLNKRMEC